MPIHNFEFKARTNKLSALEEKLLKLNPRFIGLDHQTDTYFNINSGRLKLREGNIENSLIFYERQDLAGAKQSTVLLYQHKHNPNLKEILVKSFGVKTVVEKYRKIYFIDHVKFHFDEVQGLGTFVEVEAIDKTGTTKITELQRQCEYFAEFFQIEAKDYVSKSYSDLMIGL
ncbi:MAG TPA: CYTH domain-containing protein [Bacteroidales bacterium]|nr:CYTH domain-containing protein [Bacteroidales bacterium]